MNWKELKDFCNSLDEKQLEKKVILLREEEGINSIEPETLKEDYYIGDDEDACYSLSEAGLNLEDVENKGLKKVYDKGYPILWERFTN